MLFGEDRRICLVREGRSLIELVLEAEDCFDRSDGALRRRDGLRVARRLLQQAELEFEAPDEARPPIPR